MDIDKELKRHFIGRLVENGRRIDGRDFDEFRKIDIKTNFVDGKAEGSSLVKLGETEVLCGVKVNVGEPWPDRPADGVFMTGAELSPVASPNFETGPPREEAIELARVVDRGIRESGMIDLSKLCITEGEAVWMVFVDLHVLCYDGNLIDASSIAAVSALKNTYLPKYEDETVIRGEKASDLPVTNTPVSCTFAQINGANLLDPVLDEEYAMDSRLTVTTSGKQLHAMQKGGGSGALSSDQITDLVDLAFKKHKEISKLLK